MWQAGTAAILVGSIWLLLRQLRAMRGDTLTLIAFGLIWSRFALAALGPAALQTQVAGQSLMALGTLFMVGIAAIVMPMSLFRAERAVPIYAIAALGATGTVLSGSAGALPGYVTLWVLFAALALLIDRAYTRHGPKTVLRALLAVFALPLGMQAFSILASQPKIGPDGSYSYIGGYGHEAVFAIVALGALWLTAIFPWRSRWQAWIAIAVVLAALVFANYRTILIAALPVVVAFALFDSHLTQVQRMRRLLGFGAICLLVAPAVMPQMLVERFSEVGTLAGNWEQFLKPPETFTAADKNVLSARIYIWASYVAAIGQADVPQFLIGHGADALAPGMSVHPHNEYLRVMFQHGIFGAIGLFGLLLGLAITAARARSRRPGILTAAGFAGLLLASTGTSIYDRPEGMIVLAILTATAWNLTVARSRPSELANPTAFRL